MEINTSAQWLLGQTLLNFEIPCLTSFSSLYAAFVLRRLRTLQPRKVLCELLISWKTSSGPKPLGEFHTKTLLKTCISMRTFTVAKCILQRVCSSIYDVRALTYRESRRFCFAGRVSTLRCNKTRANLFQPEAKQCTNESKIATNSSPNVTASRKWNAGSEVSICAIKYRIDAQEMKERVQHLLPWEWKHSEPKTLGKDSLCLEYRINKASLCSPSSGVPM